MVIAEVEILDFSNECIYLVVPVLPTLLLTIEANHSHEAFQVHKLMHSN